jgi:hypothetical protein
MAAIQAVNAVEIDHGDADLSCGIHNGKIEIMIGEDWAGRDHGPDRPQGYMRSLFFGLTSEEATKLRDWLNYAISQVPV